MFVHYYLKNMNKLIKIILAVETMLKFHRDKFS